MQINKIYYGVIGVGHIGNYHAQQIQKIPGVILEGVYDVLLEQAQKVSKKNKTKVYHELSDLLNKCQAVTIATPAHSHFQLAMQALHHNCHIFIEKPITTRIKEANQIIALAKKKNRLIQVGHIERFNPAFVALLKNKQIKQAPFIQTERLAPFNIRGLDVDVILDLMIHDIDLLLCIKEKKIKSIHAIGIGVLSETIDLANARLIFEDNSVANLTASRISSKMVRKLRIFNNRAYYSVNLHTHSINQYLVTDNPPHQRNNQKAVVSRKNKILIREKHTFPKQNALYQELVAFITSIHQEQTTIVDANAGKEALKLALLIQKKINEHKQK